MHDLKKLTSHGYKVITSKELAERCYKFSIKEKKQSPEGFEKFCWAFEIGLPSEMAGIEAAAYKTGILKEHEAVDWSGIALLRPVPALEVATRIDKNLRGTGCRLIKNERDKDGSAFDLKYGDQTINSRVDLDSLAIDNDALADEEFIYWPEEQAVKGATL